MISSADREAWERDGYVVLSLRAVWPEGRARTDALLERVRADMADAPPEFRSQRQHEHDDNPRIFQGWRYSAEIRALATHPEILYAIAVLTGHVAIPFQTLNFARGTQQPLHQDTIHFDTDKPPGGIVGAWVALEDVRPGSGELVVCPGSHREKRWDYGDFGIARPARGTPAEPEAYREYERKMALLATRYDPEPLRIRAGDVVIWHGNLIHGGAPITDPAATRWSQATHYVLEGHGRFVCPMFGTEKDLAALRIT